MAILEMIAWSFVPTANIVCIATQNASYVDCDNNRKTLKIQYQNVRTNSGMIDIQNNVCQPGRGKIIIEVSYLF